MRHQRNVTQEVNNRSRWLPLLGAAALLWSVTSLPAQAGPTTRVSVHSTGSQGDANSFTPVLSANGRFVAFVSSATNLVADDTNNAGDIFLHDTK